jgi:hypothetical protein
MIQVANRNIILPVLYMGMKLRVAREETERGEGGN